MLSGYDAASDFYRAVHCPAFTVEGSTQESWTDSLIGTTTTIECAASHILVGSGTLTCQEGGTWSSDIPQCDTKFGWTAVERDVDDVYFPWDLEGTPLQIKTDSVAGSDEEVKMNTFEKDGSFIASVFVKFSSPYQYKIGYCNFETDLPVQPPEEVEKIWTFVKTDTAFIISCNDVEVLNYLFAIADSPINNCVNRWSGDIVGMIQIDDDTDTASDFYRAVHCLAFTVEGSTNGSWTDSPMGTTATIECAASHILVGSATLTCQKDRSWSSDNPKCDEVVNNQSELII
eukprot:sb/3467685/